VPITLLSAGFKCLGAGLNVSKDADNSPIG
jgi:hypothetical protein